MVIVLKQRYYPIGAQTPGAVIVFLYGECQKRRLNYRARLYNADSIAAR